MDDLKDRMIKLGLTVPADKGEATRDKLFASAMEQLKEKGFTTQQFEDRKRGKRSGTFWFALRAAMVYNIY